jgi:hypothetical protein
MTTSKLAAGLVRPFVFAGVFGVLQREDLLERNAAGAPQSTT